MPFQLPCQRNCFVIGQAFLIDAAYICAFSRFDTGRLLGARRLFAAWVAICLLIMRRLREKSLILALHLPSGKIASRKPSQPGQIEKRVAHENHPKQKREFKKKIEKNQKELGLNEKQGSTK